jgi:hypothetical protein
MAAFPVPLASILWLFDVAPTTGVGALQYAFGINTVDNSLWFHIGVQPTQWIKVGDGSGGGGGSTLQAFTYVVSGDEADLSAIPITLPSPIVGGNYVVTFACQGCAGILAVDITDRDTNGFVVVGTGLFTAGDVIGFLVSPVTP